jgi:hypothetical protein
MADILNLRRARKDKARRERESAAAANRLRFGRTKAQKAAEHDTEARADRIFDGKKLPNNKLRNGFSEES